MVEKRNLIYLMHFHNKASIAKRAMDTVTYLLNQRMLLPQERQNYRKNGASAVVWQFILLLLLLLSLLLLSFRCFS